MSRHRDPTYRLGRSCSARRSTGNPPTGGAPAGAGVIRDNRAWHGGTPNLSREIRAMPNIEYVPPWHPAEYSRRTMPHELWETLSPHAQRICRLIKAEPGIWPAGAGQMHPLASERKALYKKGKGALPD